MADARKNSSTPPPLPPDEGQTPSEFDMDHLSEFARELIERRKLIEKSRDEVKEDLSGKRYVGVGGYKIATLLDNPDDIQITLRKIELNIHDYGLHEDEWNKLDDLLHEIETKYSDDDEINKILKRLRKIVGTSLFVGETLQKAMQAMPEKEAETEEEEMEVADADIEELEAEPILLTRKKEPKTEEPKKKRPFRPVLKKTTPKKNPTIRIFEDHYLIPFGDIDAAKKVLEKVKKAAERYDTSMEEEIEILRFLQETEKAYPSSTGLNDLIIEIQSIVAGKRGYHAGTKVPDVPVEPKQPTPTKAADQEPPAKAAEPPTQEPAPRATPTEPAAPAEPATPVSVKAPVQAPPQEKPKVKEKGKLKEAIQNDPFLQAVFLTSDPNQKIDKLVADGYKIKNQKHLKDLVHEFLVIFARENSKKAPGKDKSLNMASLPTCGVTPDNVGDFSQRLQTFLREKGEEAAIQPVEPPAPPAPPVPPTVVEPPKSEPPANPVAPTVVEDNEPIPPTVRSMVPPAIKPDTEPAPKIPVVTVESAKAEPVKKVEPAKVEEPPKKKATPEDVNKVLDKLFEALKEDPNFKELMEMTQLLKIDERTLQKGEWQGFYKMMVQYFGTDRRHEVVKKMKDDSLRKYVDPAHYMTSWEIDRKTSLRRLLVGAEGELTPETAQREVSKMLGKMKRIKTGEEEPKSAVTPEPAPDTARSSGLPAPVSVTPPPSATPSPAPASATPASTPTPPAAEPPAEPPKSDAELKAEAEAKAKEEAELQALREKYKDNPVFLKFIEAFGPEGEKFIEEEIAKRAEAEVKVKEDLAKRTKMPETLATAIEQAAGGDADKKQKLFDLWEVANDNAKLDNKDLTDEVRRIMKDAHTHSKSARHMRVAVNSLAGLLSSTEKAKVLPMDPEVSAFNRLRRTLDNYFDGRLDEVFEILEVNPIDYPDDADFIEGVQMNVKKLLFSKIPVPAGATDYSTLLETIKSMDASDRAKAFQEIEQAMESGDLADDIEKFFEIVDANEPGSTPPTLPSTPPAAPSAGVARTRYARSTGSSASSGTASSASTTDPASAPSATPSGAPAAVNLQSKLRDFPSESDKKLAINGLISRMGFKADSLEPAVIAIATVLDAKIHTINDLEGLEYFLTTASFETEIDPNLRNKSLEELENEKEGKDERIRQVETDITNITRQLSKTKIGDDVEEKLNAKRGELTKAKLILVSERRSITDAIERKKQRKNKETLHYRTPEQLLGMINMHFAKRASGEDKTPDYIKVLTETREQLEEAKKPKIGKAKRFGFWAYNRLAPWGYLKPTLTSTLKAVAAKDPALKNVKPEDAVKLADSWDRPQGVEAWIQGLAGSEKEKMESVVPALISHLSDVMNNGRMANINSLSVNRARSLLFILRRSVHEYAIKHAESQKGDSLAKMSSYFAELNDISKKSENRENIVTWNSRFGMLANMGKVAGGALVLGGIGVGGVTIASLGIPGALAATGAAAAVATKYSSYRVKDPKTKELLSKTATRCLWTGALGGAALLATPWLLPAAATAGLFSSEIWKNRKQIKDAAGPTARVGFKGVRGTARVGWAGLGAYLSTFALGLPLISKTYRNAFGLNENFFKPL